MSYAAFGTTTTDSCPAGYAPYRGDCLSVEEQQLIGPTLCRPTEHWNAAEAGCECNAGYARDLGTMYCVPAPSAAVGAARHARLLAVGALVCCAALLGWHYYGGG